MERSAADLRLARRTCAPPARRQACCSIGSCRKSRRTSNASKSNCIDPIDSQHGTANARSPATNRPDPRVVGFFVAPLGFEDAPGQPPGYAGGEGKEGGAVPPTRTPSPALPRSTRRKMRPLQNYTAGIEPRQGNVCARMNQYAPTVCAAGLCLAGLIISWCATGMMKRLSPRIGFVDKPGTRKIHHVPKPLGGGVAIVLGFALPLIALLLVLSFVTPPTPASWGILGKIASRYPLTASLVRAAKSACPWRGTFSSLRC